MHIHQCTMHINLSCAACGRPLLATSSAVCCPGCKALHYCSPQHLQGHQQHAHGAEECRRMAEQLQRGPALLEHNMPWELQDTEQLKAWVQGCCSSSSGMVQFCLQLHFLSQQQQSGINAPQAEQQQGAEARLGMSLVGPPALPTTQQQWQRAWGLCDPCMMPPWSSTQPQRATQQVQPAVPGWKQYYDMRGVDHRSPAALVLHPVLTLYHCLVSILPSHGWQLPPAGDTIHVAYLGPRQELFLLPAFVELALLLPQHHLDIHFVGPDVPDDLHGKACAVDLGPDQGGGRLRVSCWSTCFHDVLDDWAHQQQNASSMPPAAAAVAQQGVAMPGWGPAAAPHPEDFQLVFAANAGLPAFASWLPTLQRLAALDVPVLFSDYCEEAAFMSQQLAKKVLHKPFTLDCCLNPFRDPVPATAHGTSLPACSNGFLFGWA